MLHPPHGAPGVASLRQILATRSLHRSSHRPTKALTVTEWTESRNWTESTETYGAKRSEQAELAIGEAAEARPRGQSALRHNSDGLAVTYLAATRDLPIVIWHRQDQTQ